MPPIVDRIIKEPLLHFLLIGVLLFGLFAVINKDSAGPTNRIAITRADIEQLQSLFQRQWQRSPTPQELQALIDGRIREEVLYREALAMGLEKDDVIVRRRLAQKTEFLITDVTDPSQVDDKDLMAFYEKHPERYARDVKLSFRHIYFNPEQRGKQLLDEANATLNTLRTTRVGIDAPKPDGDRFMLPSRYQLTSASDIARDFGRAFADTLVTLDPDSWQGPIESGYGVHLVYIQHRETTGRRPFSEVHEMVKNDYLYELRQKRSAEIVQKLKSRYTITIAPVH